MGLIKERFLEIINNCKNIFKHIPLTLIIVLIGTIINALYAEVKLSEDFYNIFVGFLVLFGVSTFFIETYFNKKNKKIIGYLISAIISIILSVLINIEENIFGIDISTLKFYLYNIIAVYIGVFVILAVYNIYKKSGKRFEDYVMIVFKNMMITGIIYFILAIGAAVITGIFSFLITDLSIWVVEILIFGFYLGPSILYNLINVENTEISKFVRVIVKYILDVLIILAFVIIYIYILKILILQDMPSNQVFRIIAALFIIGCPIWTIASSLDEGKLLDKINSKLPLLFIPFIFLEIYTLGIRIINNGITEARYIGVVLIILQIIYLAIYIKNKEKIGNILLVIIVFIGISLIVPYVNMYNVSIISQSSILKTYKEKSELSDEDKSKMLGAYYYLKYHTIGKNHVSDIISDDEIDVIREIKLDEYKRAPIVYVGNGLYINRTIDVEGYKKIYSVSKTYYSGKFTLLDTFKEIKFDSVEKNITVDINSLVEEYIKHNDEFGVYFSNNYEYMIDENTKLVLNKFTMSYDSENDIVYSYDLEGFICEK